MSIICALFGHKPLTNSGWYRGVGYARTKSMATDNMNTHLYLEAECPRCGEKYAICNVHVHRDYAAQETERRFAKTKTPA